jgi:hypothetical protein
MATELGIALARRGHEIHFITYQQPFRLPSFLPGIYFHEVDVGRYPLFEYPPYDLALACACTKSSARTGWTCCRALRDSACHQRLDRAGDAPRIGDDIAVVTTLHGTDITIVGQDHSFHAITKFSIEKPDGSPRYHDSCVTRRSSRSMRWLRVEVIHTHGPGS